MSRKYSRKIILQKLYRDEFHSSKEKANPRDSQFVFEEKTLNSNDKQYARDILTGIKSKRKDIDKIINKHVKNWKPERISLVDLNIMRIAIFEILFYQDTPDKVALNEALELAKKFGEQNSVSFINGILDQILKKESKSVSQL